jgi:multiple sugar transport system substrate-binding protein
MKPFQIILLSVFGVLALVGLFVFTTYSGFSSTKNAVGSIVVWGTLPQDGVSQALQALSSASPDYKDVTYKQIPAAQFDGQLADALASGVGPDLIIISQEQLLTEAPRLNVIPFSTIPQRTYVNTYVPEANLFLGSAGTYGIPYVIDPLVMYYNQSLLASAGIATPPATWEAINGVAQKLTQQTGNQTIIKSAVALGGYGNVTNARSILSLLMLQAGNSITQNVNGGFRSVLSQAPAGTFGATPAESSLNFYTQFANPSKTTYSWNASLPTSQHAFLSGDLALYFGFASERSFLQDANPNLRFDMTPIPQPSAAAANISYANIYAFAIPKASKHAAAAYQTAIAMTDTKPLLIAAYGMGMAPAKRALLTPSADDLYGPVYFPEALTAQGWLSPTPATTDRIFAGMIDAVVTGRSVARDALITAEQSFNAALH